MEKYQTKFQQGSPEWLSYRRKIITATDVSSIIGISPFCDYYDLVLSKWDIESNNKMNKQKMEWGLYCESVARDYFCLKYKKQVKEVNLCVHDVYNWLGASPDGIILNENGLLEIKCPSTEIYDGIPDHYYSQMQIQMEVLKADYCYFWVCKCEKGLKKGNYYYCDTKDVSIVDFKKEVVFYRPSFLKTYFNKLKIFYDNIIVDQDIYLFKSSINTDYLDNSIQEMYNIYELLSIHEGEEVQPWLTFQSMQKRDNSLMDKTDDEPLSKLYFNEIKNKTRTMFLSSMMKSDNDLQTVYYDNKVEKLALTILSKKSLGSFIILKPELYLENIKSQIDFGYRSKDGEYRFIWISCCQDLIMEVKKDKWLLNIAFVEIAIEKLLNVKLPRLEFYLFNQFGVQQPILYKDDYQKNEYKNKIICLLHRWNEIQKMSNIDNCEMNMNYKHDKPMWKNIRRDLAYKRGEPTLLWCVTRKRKLELLKDEKIKSFWSPQFNQSKTIQKDKKRFPIIFKMVENEKNPLIIPSRLAKSRLLKKNSTNIISPRGVKHNGLDRVYVDFETVHINGKTCLFQIGVGYYWGENRQWNYKSFITMKNVLKNEGTLVKRWIKWLENSGVNSLIHWSAAEPSIYREMMRRYSFIPDISTKWIDMLPIFREKYMNLEVKGLFDFSLKHVADIMCKYGYIEENYLSSDIQSGFDAMIHARNYFIKNNGRYRYKADEFKKDIEKYNELDVKILGEIDLFMLA